MDVFEGGEVGLFVFGFEVNDLAADHAVDGAGGVGDFANDGDARLGWTNQLGEHFIGLCLQGVSGEDGDGLSKDFVAGGASAPQVVVIKRGQIVVNQGVGVEHFERRAHLLDACGQRAGCVSGTGFRGARFFEARFSRATAAAIMRPASMQRIGRRRFPPAKTLCRMA